MPIEVMTNPFTVTGAAQRQGDILAGKTSCFDRSLVIGHVNYLGVQRARMTQRNGFVGLKVGET